ncbi:MAG: hypothetical protein GF308_05880 [Candidatus Heimdallarchaeota archaeon]|nr:hypothetical protein [Candidatus Heimdallarchaeota archaeon]
MRSVKKIPKLKKEHFERWADEIIKQYSLTEDTSLADITESVAKFFDQYFENYEVSAMDPQTDGIFPFSFEKKGTKPPVYGDEKFWVDEVFEVENHIHWTYVTLLTKLNREKECPFDTAECPY